MPLEIDKSEHAPIRQVTVVRYGQHLAPCLGLITVEEFPEHGGVFAVERGERDYHIRLSLAVTEDHDAMQIVATVVGGPFVTYERSEFTRLVVPLRCGRVVLPNRLD